MHSRSTAGLRVDDAAFTQATPYIEASRAKSFCIYVHVYVPTDVHAYRQFFTAPARFLLHFQKKWLLFEMSLSVCMLLLKRPRVRAMQSEGFRTRLGGKLFPGMRERSNSRHKWLYMQPAAPMK